METLAGAFEQMMDALSQEYKSIEDEFVDYEEQEYDRFNSIDPNSRRMELLEEILYSAEAYDYGIRLIARDRLWEQQINRFGVPLPLYKPRTIRYKAKRGFPPDKMVRYTEFDKGAFYNEGINIVVNRSADFFDFYITDRRPYFAFIPEDVVGLTEENEEIFKYQIGEWLNNRLLEDWMFNEG